MWVRSTSAPCPGSLCTWKGHVSLQLQGLTIYFLWERRKTQVIGAKKKPCVLGQALAPLGNEEHPCVKSRGSLDDSTGWMPCTVSPSVGKWACWCIFQWRGAFQVWSPSVFSAEPQPHISFFPRQWALSSVILFPPFHNLLPAVNDGFRSSSKSFFLQLVETIMKIHKRSAWREQNVVPLDCSITQHHT